MQLSCTDLGGKGCDFVASGEGAQEVKKAMWVHAWREHSDMVAGMSDDDRAAMDARMDERLA